MIDQFRESNYYELFLPFFTLISIKCVSLFEILKKEVKITFMEKRVTGTELYGEVKNDKILL